MTVKELIDFLEDCNPEAKVLVEAPFHDGTINSKVIDMAIEPELDRLGDFGSEVIIDIAVYQVSID